MTTTEGIEADPVVVGFDGSPGAHRAVRWAIEAAKRRSGQVLLVQSCREPLYDGRAWAEVWDDPYAARTRAEAELGTVLDAIALEHPGVGFTGRVELGKAADVLVEAADDGQMVVVGSRGRGGFAELLLGSTARAVAGHARSTVVVVRGDEHPEGPIVVGVDGSECSRRALAWAADEARRRGAKLHVVMAWSYLLPEREHGPTPFDADYTGEEAVRVLDAICSDVLGARPDVDLRKEATCDLAARALLERAEGASLLVVGPRRLSLRERVDLGSVAAQVIHHAPCPLAIVREPLAPAAT